jgi:hypothetical protein
MNESKEIVTSDKYAADVMSFVQRHGALFCAELHKEAEKTWSLAPDEITTLHHEIFLAFLWAASKALASDRKVVDSLHYSYFQSCYHSGATYEESAARVGAAQAELSDRYEQYYEAWDHDMKISGGMALGFEMSQFFFPRHRPVLTSVHSLVESNIQTFIQNLLQFRKQFQLKGAYQPI